MESEAATFKDSMAELRPVSSVPVMTATSTVKKVVKLKKGSFLSLVSPGNS